MSLGSNGPLQVRETFGFQYQGSSDPLQYLEEEILNVDVFSRVQWLLKNVKHMLLIPNISSAANPLKQVWFKVVDLCLLSTLY